MSTAELTEETAPEDGTYVELRTLTRPGQDAVHRWELRRVGGEVLEHGAWHPGRAQPTKDGSTHGRRVATRVEADSLFAEPEAPEVVDTLPL